MLPHTEKAYIAYSFAIVIKWCHKNKYKKIDQHYDTGYQRTIKMHQQKRSIRDFHEEKQKEYLPKTAHMSR